MRAWYKTACSCLLLSVTTTQNSGALAQTRGGLTEIIDPISPEALIRLEDNKFCGSRLCVTIVTRKCEHPICPYVAVFVPPQYFREPFGGFWGELLRFPALESNSLTSVVVNDRFMAAFSGL